MSLTPAELERLAIFMEECGECIQAVGKILRHGYEDKHLAPNKATGTILNNRETLEVEMGDLLLSFHDLVDAGDINKKVMLVHYNNKKERNRFLHHQG